MSSGISVVILSIKVIARLDEHLQYSESVLKPGRQVQSIVSILVSVVNVDSVLCQDSHDVPMATPRCDPERIQAFFILLVYVDHLVLEHQLDKCLAISQKQQSYHVSYQQ